MNYSLTDHQVLEYYLQTLSKAEIQQTKHFSQWAENDYSKYFRDFLTEQQELARHQQKLLDALEHVSDVYPASETCEPVEGLLREIEKINQYSDKNADLLEPVVAQLLQCLKHYELVTYQAALVLARSLEEIRIVSVLTEILEEEERAYLHLQNFIVSRRQNTRTPFPAEK